MFPGVKSVSAFHSKFHIVSTSPATQDKSALVEVLLAETIPDGSTQLGDSNIVTTIFDQSASDPP